MFSRLHLVPKHELLPQSCLQGGGKAGGWGTGPCIEAHLDARAGAPHQDPDLCEAQFRQL